MGGGAGGRVVVGNLGGRKAKIELGAPVVGFSTGSAPKQPTPQPAQPIARPRARHLAGPWPAACVSARAGPAPPQIGRLPRVASNRPNLAFSASPACHALPGVAVPSLWNLPMRFRAADRAGLCWAASLPGDSPRRGAPTTTQIPAPRSEPGGMRASAQLACEMAGPARRRERPLKSDDRAGGIKGVRARGCGCGPDCGGLTVTAQGGQRPGGRAQFLGSHAGPVSEGQSHPLSSPSQSRSDRPPASATDHSLIPTLEPA